MSLYFLYFGDLNNQFSTLEEAQAAAVHITDAQSDPGETQTVAIAKVVKQLVIQKPDVIQPPTEIRWESEVNE